MISKYGRWLNNTMFIRPYKPVFLLNVKSSFSKLVFLTKRSVVQNGYRERFARRFFFALDGILPIE